jgi:hypothetical protein
VTEYNDAAWVIGQRTREEFEQRFRMLIAEQMVTARYYRRLVRIAHRRGHIGLFRDLALRSIALRRSAFMLCVEMRADGRGDHGDRHSQRETRH